MGDFPTVGEVIMWPIRIVLTLFIVGTFILVEAKAISNSTDVGFQEAGLLSSKFLYDSNCLMKSGDVAGKTYSDVVIELNKFNQDNLEKCNTRKGFSAKLTLEYGSNTMEALVENQAGDYRIDSGACFDDKRFNCVFNRYYVLVDDHGKIIPGFLSINAVVRKNV